MPAPSKAPRQHGDRQKYLKERCRCDKCRAAQTQYMAGLRESKVGWEGKRKVRRKAEHGTRTMYQKYKCRCDPCVRANNDYAAEWIATKRWRQRLGLDTGH